jgi:thiamine-phosphate pyrophosphorylase
LSDAPAAVPRLYVITDRRATGGRPLAGVVRAALAGAAGAPGAVVVQLREKDLGGAALAALARELRAVTADAGAALYVNDRADVALAVGADGVHLGGGSLAPADVARMAPALAVAVSTHGRADVEAAAHAARAPRTNLRFAVFGPVFETPSKRAFGPPPGLEGLAAAASAGLPLLALGGVSPDRAAACRAAGARGVACIRAVMGAADPAAVVRAFLSAFQA